MDSKQVSLQQVCLPVAGAPPQHPQHSYSAPEEFDIDKQPKDFQAMLDSLNDSELRELRDQIGKRIDSSSIQNQQTHSSSCIDPFPLLESALRWYTRRPIPTKHVADVWIEAWKARVLSSDRFRIVQTNMGEAIKLKTGQEPSHKTDEFWDSQWQGYYGPQEKSVVEADISVPMDVWTDIFQIVYECPEVRGEELVQEVRQWYPELEIDVLETLVQRASSLIDVEGVQDPTTCAGIFAGGTMSSYSPVSDTED